jgi:hypothetical protein
MTNPITGRGRLLRAQHMACCCAAEQRDELPAFQLIELHFGPRQPGPTLQDIELSANSQPGWERLVRRTSTFLVARRSRHKSSAAEKMPLLVGFAHSALRLKALKNRDHLGTPG